MAIRWIHKGWKTVWKIVFTILLIIIVFVGGALGLLQLNATKGIIAEKIENSFKKNYNGKLSIGDLQGFLPFNATLKNVALTSTPDSAAADTLLQFQSAEVSIDLWALIHKDLRITHFKIDHPAIRLISDGGGYTLSNALAKESPDSSSSGGGWIKNVSITAPNLTINNGSLYAENVNSSSKKVQLPNPLRVDDIDARLFLELTNERRYAEVENFSADVQGMQAGEIRMAGQVFNNDQVLEFNSFHLAAGRSRLNLNGSIDSVNVYKPDLHRQLMDAHYNIRVGSPRLETGELTDVLPTLPDLKKPVNFSLQANGKINTINLKRLKFGLGDSYFSINGELNQIQHKQRLNYNFHIDTLAVQKNDLQALTGKFSPAQAQALQQLQLKGVAEGTADSLFVNIAGKSELGSFTFNGLTQLDAPHLYRGGLKLNNFDIGPLTGSAIDTTNLNFNAYLQGENTSLTTGRLSFEGQAQNSLVNHTAIDSLQLKADLQQGKLHASYRYRFKKQSIQGKATADFNKKDPPITLDGNTKNVNLAALFPKSSLDTTRLNTHYKVDMQGLKPDRIQGTFAFTVQPSVIRGDSVGAHTIQIQLDSPDQPTRTLQVNSSLFDLKVTGTLKPSRITRETTYWSNYFKEHIAREIRFDSTAFVPGKQVSGVRPVQAEGHIQAKNLRLLKQYLPSFPSLETNSNLHFSVSADSANLQFSSQIQSDTLRLNTVQIKGAGSRIEGHFNHDESFKESGNLSVEMSAHRIKSNLVKMDSVDLNLRYARDSLYYSQQVERFSKNARFNLQVRSKLTSSDIKVSIDKFFLGNNKYAWQSEGTPQLIYNRAQKIIFNSFSFKNQNELFALKGSLSPDRSDSLQTIVRNVKLGRISNLLRTDFDFSGILNGRLRTRSLGQKPSLAGHLQVDSLKLRRRLVGDVTFKSQYNENDDRFDMKLKVLTDSTKYQKYLKANNGIGQNIVLDGYFKPANIQTKKDSVFYFDANFKQIDIWVVQLFTGNIFERVQGRASGQGVISGNFNDINLSANFHVHDVLAHPRFLETNLYLNGLIRLNNKKGVVLDDVNIHDEHNGTGSINGKIDFIKTASQPFTVLNLKIRLNDLQFVNSNYNPEYPFYGTMGGTGTIQLSGPTTDLTLKSLSDIHISRNSTFAFPLLGGTEVNSNNNFIKFVDSFEHPSQNQINLSEHDFINSDISAEKLHQAASNLSFSERFNMDLQFDAPEPINVQVIFDPLTQEALHARGTGHLRLTMNEGNTQIFGQFNVLGGSYNFVSGEIFSRKLDLRPGGKITWEGPPDNAKIDMEAVYQARPSLSSLNGASASSTESRQVPVDLVVGINGTLDNIQNNYHFEVPQSIASSSSSTLQYRLNQINNDQQQKLYQATSVLLTGEFLNTGSGRSQTSQLGSNLKKGSTFINPLLSNQVISPLLSNQINSLLNSDVTQFDIDFELNKYNQIDLGVALRLYHDKVILRREGYLTGGSTNASFGERIGDLRATYRINNNLSLNAFHRQDQTLGTVVTNSGRNDIAPTENGAGIEAKVRFNTWQDLVHKVRNFFRRLFGKNEINFKRRAQNESQGEQTTPRIGKNN